MPEFGFVYCVSSESMPGLVKIGMTANSPWARAQQLSTTSIPKPFQVQCCLHVPHCRQAEKHLHRVFASRRYNRNREFFSVGPAEVYPVLKEMDGNMLWAEQWIIDLDQGFDPSLVFSRPVQPAPRKLSQAETLDAINSIREMLRRPSVE